MASVVTDERVEDSTAVVEDMPMIGLFHQHSIDGPKRFEVAQVVDTYFCFLHHKSHEYRFDSCNE
jgi:hypothetical protein